MDGKAHVAYTPHQDIPLEGCPRITEEEFQSLAEKGREIAKARKEFYVVQNEILARYGRKSIEENWEDGQPKKTNGIVGHNLLTFDCVY